MPFTRILLLILMFICSGTLIAENNNNSVSNRAPDRSDKLSIKFIVLEDSPDFGAIDYELRYPGKDEFITVQLEFNMVGVKAIIVSDVNAENNLCHRNQVKHSIFLSFAEPDKNITSIITRISEPCYVNDIATLKLSIKTNKNKYFYNLVKLKRLK